MSKCLALNFTHDRARETAADNLLVAVNYALTSATKLTARQTANLFRYSMDYCVWGMEIPEDSDPISEKLKIIEEVAYRYDGFMFIFDMISAYCANGLYIIDECPPLYSPTRMVANRITADHCDDIYKNCVPVLLWYEL